LRERLEVYLENLPLGAFRGRLSLEEEKIQELTINIWRERFWKEEKRERPEI